MAAKRKKKWGKGRESKLSPKKMLNHSLAYGASKIDFLKLLKSIANSSQGRPWMEHFKDLAPAWPFQNELTEKAVGLCIEDLKDQKAKFDERDVVSTMDAIRCRYDHDVHRHACAALTTICQNLFVQDNPGRPFTSRDGREWRHLDQLKKYREQGLGVVYLINHSSHLDEFLLNIQLMHATGGLPLYAAGANMMAIPSLAKLLMMGSYVVQRRGSGRVGLSALYNYCRAISVMGGEQGIFLEAWHGGARSRDGSLRYPRRLVTLRGALDVEGDVVVQPVAVSYSIIPEDLDLCARQGGMGWARGISPLGVVGNLLIHPASMLWRSIKGAYGRAYVDLAPPLLLSELKKRHKEDEGGLELDEFVALTCIKQIARIKKVMSSQLVARGLSRGRRESRMDIKQGVQYELGVMTEYHQTNFGQDPDLEDFIRNHSQDEMIQDGLRTLKIRKVVARHGKDEQGRPLVLNEAGLSFYATHGDRRIYSPTADQNVVVVGSDGWGFALTHLIGQRMLEAKRYYNASMTLFEPDPETAREMNISRRAPEPLENYHLPKNAFVTSDLTSAFRKASEVILVPPRRKLAEVVSQILDTSEQGLKVVVGTCGFEPESHRLPCQLVLDMAKARGRDDVSVFALVGAVKEEHVLTGKTLSGLLAGPPEELRKLSDLFRLKQVDIVTSDDPLGVQAASILARAYALWGHYLARSGEIRGAGQVGAYMARAASEATELGLALGGKSSSFAAGSPAWTATLVAEGLSGTCREFGLKLGGQAKKREDVPSTARTLYNQMEDLGRRLTGYEDIRSAYLAARRMDLQLPILEEAYSTIWGADLSQIK